jgi:hypothetical protein
MTRISSSLVNGTSAHLDFCSVHPMRYRDLTLRYAAIAGLIASPLFLGTALILSLAQSEFITKLGLHRSSPEAPGDAPLDPDPVVSALGLWQYRREALPRHSGTRGPVGRPNERCAIR